MFVFTVERNLKLMHRLPVISLKMNGKILSAVPVVAPLTATSKSTVWIMDNMGIS